MFFIIILRYSCQYSLYRFFIIFFQKIYQKNTKCSTTVYFIYTLCFNNSFKPLYIFGSIALNRWALTPSFKDSCFQAYLSVVLTQKYPFSLKEYSRILTWDLGCFPLDLGSSHPKSVCIITFICIYSFIRLSKIYNPPHLLRAIPQIKIIIRST